MTATARTVLPTDLVALVSYDGRVYANEAVTRDRIGTQDSPHPLEAAFEQWFSFATGRHTWISVKGPTLRGLVSARKRGSRLAWEVDCLIDAAEDESAVLISLLDQMTQAAGKSGAEKIFLRLPIGSYSEQAALRCGFARYQRERVYRRERIALAAAMPAALRRRTKADAYPLFQLYNAVTPQEVRRHEAATLAEWNAAQERLGPRRTQHWVLPGEGGGLAGWLQLAADGDIGRFQATGDHDALDALLDAAEARLASRKALYTVAAAHQDGVCRRLELRGYQAGDEYGVLVRRTTRPVRVAEPVPALANTTLV
jgi:hypothetical protein